MLENMKGTHLQVIGHLVLSFFEGCYKCRDVNAENYVFFGKYCHVANPINLTMENWQAIRYNYGVWFME